MPSQQLPPSQNPPSNPPSTPSDEPIAMFTKFPSPSLGINPPPPSPNPASSIQHPASSHNSLAFTDKHLLTRNLFIIASVFILVLSSFFLSFFFSSGGRQPKIFSRASQPSPSLALGASPSQTLGASPSAPPADLPTQAGGQPVTSSFGSLTGETAGSSPSLTLGASPSAPPTAGLSAQADEKPATITSSPPPAPKNLPPIIFEISVEKDTFSPNQITASRDQIVTLYIAARDKTYDISFPEFGLYQIIPQGERKTVEFQAQTVGQTVFSCRDYCYNTDTLRGLLTIKL